MFCRSHDTAKKEETETKFLLLVLLLLPLFLLPLLLLRCLEPPPGHGLDVPAAGHLRPICARNAEGARVGEKENGEDEALRQPGWQTLSRHHRPDRMRDIWQTGPAVPGFHRGSGGARHIEGGLPGPRQLVRRGVEDEGKLRPPAALTLAASRLPFARQDHRGAPVRGIGIGGESGSSGHTTPGSQGSLRGRFNWASSGGLKRGVYCRVLIVKLEI